MLTPEEQAEFSELDAEFGKKTGLTPEEQAEFEELDAIYGQAVPLGLPEETSEGIVQESGATVFPVDDDPQIESQSLSEPVRPADTMSSDQAMSMFDQAIQQEEEYLSSVDKKDRAEIEDLMSKIREKVDQGSYLDTVLHKMFQPKHPEIEQLKVDEGTKTNSKGQHISYYATKEEEEKGLVTGGYGHLMTAAERKKYPAGTVIPQAVVDKWFAQDIREAQEDVRVLLGGKEVPEEVERILVNMAFNLGRQRLKGFKGMWKAIEDKEWGKAADEMEFVDATKKDKNTLWWKQVKGRAERLVQRMRSVDNAGTS